MTEIPEHLLKRAQAAREKAAAESGAGAAADTPAAAADAPPAADVDAKDELWSATGISSP